MREGAKKQSFKRLLLNKCQQEFEKFCNQNIDEEVDKLLTHIEWDKLQAPDKRDELEDAKSQRFELLLKLKRRALGNVHFIGELFKKSMLGERSMHCCLEQMLGMSNGAKPAEVKSGKGAPALATVPDDEDLEATCKLFTAIGKHLDVRPQPAEGRPAARSRPRSIAVTEEGAGRIPASRVHSLPDSGRD